MEKAIASQSKGREFESHRRLNFFFLFFFVCLLTDIQKTFTETERLLFQYVKENLPKQCLLSDETSISKSKYVSLGRALISYHKCQIGLRRANDEHFPLKSNRGDDP